MEDEWIDRQQTLEKWVPGLKIKYIHAHQNEELYRKIFI